MQKIRIDVKMSAAISLPKAQDLILAHVNRMLTGQQNLAAMSRTCRCSSFSQRAG
jgi:hypothetical protein